MIFANLLNALHCHRNCKTNSMDTVLTKTNHLQSGDFIEWLKNQPERVSRNVNQVICNALEKEITAELIQKPKFVKSLFKLMEDNEFYALKGKVNELIKTGTRKKPEVPKLQPDINFLRSSFEGLDPNETIL